MAVNEESRLGCGRLVDDVWADADRPPDAHEQTCPFCQQARATMLGLSEATDALRGYEEQDPEYVPSVAVKDLVMQLVHIEVRRGRALPLRVPETEALVPRLAISEQAVLDVVWQGADAIPGVRGRHCAVVAELTEQRPGEAGTVRIELHVALAAGVSIPEVTGRLRDHLRRHVADETGLHTSRIDVTVEDLYDA
ncbi:Asp23/Gls24 family envelope stress response protein [uncultured Friedmanniella sp.]|uniref:Asp23/Gls24 family envelope stress response protein n=1 Tax=uncultured Friedmanniella sp. TaxID=335381 RepID=UPI0035CB4795